MPVRSAIRLGKGGGILICGNRVAKAIEEGFVSTTSGTGPIFGQSVPPCPLLILIVDVSADRALVPGHDRLVLPKSDRILDSVADRDQDGHEPVCGITNVLPQSSQGTTVRAPTKDHRDAYPTPRQCGAAPVARQVGTARVLRLPLQRRPLSSILPSDTP